MSVIHAGALRGIALMLLSTLFFSGMHGFIRYLSAEIHPFEIAFFRNLFGAIVVVPWFVRYGLAPLKTQKLRLHLLRATLNVVSMLCFFYALSRAPMAQVTAITFSAPIFATVIAVLFLKEVVHWRHWIAIVIGFAGTIVVLRPGDAVFEAGAVAALVSAVVWAVALVDIKILARTESSVTITSYMMVLLIPLSIGPALTAWTWPSNMQLLYLCILGMLGTTGHLLMNQGFKEAEASLLMPLDFIRLLWISAIGYFAFAEIPDSFVWFGGVMIFMSAFGIAREGRRASRLAKASKLISAQG